MNKLYIPWESQSDLWWNEICAKVVEHFGNPGDRYITSPDEDWMEIEFKSKEDYLMCKMLLSEHIVNRTSWTLQVDENGVIILNDEILEKTGWQEGDELEFENLNNGSFLIKRKA